jgi:predicted esterase
MLSGMDHLDLAGLIAPRPLLIESGTDDPIFPVAAARREHELLATLYQLLGASDRLEHDVFEGGHRWHGDRAYPFLERWLGPVRDS